jgi:peptidase E
VLIAGESAGMICWIEQGVSDSRPDDFTAVGGLGWLEGSGRPHYRNKDRRPSCHRLLLAGAGSQ